MNQLLASPLFHRMVRGVHRKINHLRYGPPPEDMGGTKIDVNCKRFVLPPSSDSDRDAYTGFDVSSRSRIFPTPVQGGDQATAERQPLQAKVTESDIRFRFPTVFIAHEHK